MSLITWPDPRQIPHGMADDELCLIQTSLWLVALAPPRRRPPDACGVRCVVTARNFFAATLY